MVKFDPQLTLIDSAQCFHWKRTTHGWAAIVAGKPLFVREGEIPQDRIYFDLDRDYEALRASETQFPVIGQMMDELPGLRVLRQPTWETVVAFILSANNNAARIRSLVWKVCSLGEEAVIDDTVVRGFPTPDALIRAGSTALREMGCGYRAEYLTGTAKMVADGFDLDELSRMDYDAAHKQVQKLPGVGPKVADCILLFGCGHTCAFPVDVWMARAMEMHFGMAGLSRDKMRIRAQEIFGRDAGLIQQYIFHMMRTKRMEA